MKKKLFFVFALGLLLTFQVKSVNAQLYDKFQEKTNLVFFSGLVYKQNNPTDKGVYYGVYADYLAFKSSSGHLSFGPFAVLSCSSSQYSLGNGLNEYENYGGGISAGFYNPDFSFKHQIFIGMSLGLNYGRERQQVKEATGIYQAVQEDVFLNTGLNFSILKSFGLQPDLFPRSQIQFHLKLPLKSTKEAYWNNEAIQNEPWDKTYFEVIAKENIFQAPIGWRQEFFYAPKLVGFYSYQAGDSRSYYGLGAEVSLRREYRDDFLSLNVIYKESQSFECNYWIVGLNFNLSSLLKK